MSVSHLIRDATSACSGSVVTSKPLCEIKCLNLWKYLWLHHLSGKMSLVSADLVILPPGHGS